VITLVLGGTRSGKSEVAEGLVPASGTPVTYVATGRVTDEDMAARVAAHRARRPAGWATVELGPGAGRDAGVDAGGEDGGATGGADLPAVLAGLRGHVLVDSLGTWVASDPALAPDTAGLCAALAARARSGGDTVLVSEEVGMGVHPPTEVGRRFADALGTLNRSVAERADRVLLVVAGRLLPLDRAGSPP
jgi:adenosyl cobinamide kinase/adenosyl cobinamide phosphate guanylyltransferase